MAALQFQLNTTSPGGKARAGTLTTDHGVIETPIFMPGRHSWQRKSGNTTAIIE
jgi:queuine/archaeosine tRNA-ribosyltransferase